MSSSDASSEMSRGSMGRQAETGHKTREDSAFVNGNAKLKEVTTHTDAPIYTVHSY